MEAVLYICHGSRLKKAQEEAASFVRRSMLENPYPIQEYGFLELATPSIEQAFHECVKKGATKIIAIPVLLLSAGHAKFDIPHELEKLNSQFPKIEVVLGNPIGVHPAISQLLIERMNETKQRMTENTRVLLVGRGSSDPDVKKDLNKIASHLQAHAGIQQVDTCFLVGTSPNFEEGLQKAINDANDNIIVMPYILFTGILMGKIAKTIEQYSKNTNKEIFLSNYLGYHPILQKILLERIQEANKKITCVSV